jgi:hypothetical protein
MAKPSHTPSDPYPIVGAWETPLVAANGLGLILRSMAPNRDNRRRDRSRSDRRNRNGATGILTEFGVFLRWSANGILYDCTH